MKPRFFLPTSITLLSISLLFGCDFWKEKHFTEWSDKDIRKMLNKSPWAKEVRISTTPMAPKAQGATVQRGAVPLPQQITLVVRWESSLPVKQAQAVRRYGA